MSAVFTAQGVALGETRQQAIDRARAQASTLLDSYTQNFTTCPAACPSKTVDIGPDYDAGPPAFAPAPNAADIFSCTVQLARVVTLTCGSDGSTSAPADGGSTPGGGTSTAGGTAPAAGT